MIKSLKIKNFESWEDAEIEFHPGINVIVGESDEGKSSLVRALKLNTLNRPKGFHFRSDFLTKNQDITSVEIEYDSGDKIIRQRNLAGLNEYKINDKSLVALRSDVPTEISDISKISSINIQGQHPTEQYFLLAERPGHVSKEFNKVADLTIMDDAMADINSQVRTAKSKLDIYQKDQKDKEDLIKKNEWIFKAKEDATQIKEISNAFQKIEKVKTKLKSIILSLTENKSQLGVYKCLKEAQKHMGTLFLLKTKINRTKDTLNSLNTAVKSIKDTTLELNTMSGIDDALNTLKTLKNVKDEQNQIEKKNSNLLVIIQKIEDNENRIQKAEKDFKEITLKFRKTMQTEECPVCGRIG